MNVCSGSIAGAYYSFVLIWHSPDAVPSSSSTATIFPSIKSYVSYIGLEMTASELCFPHLY